MLNPTVISALPVGEFDTDAAAAEFNAILEVFKRPDIALTVAAPVSDEAGARRFIQELSEPLPDLILIIPLRGLSAQVSEAVGRAAARPCLIWPITGRYALSSSTLATGALREAGVPVELLFAPPDHPPARLRAERFIRAARAWSRLRRSRIGLVGGLMPNLVSCRYDAATLTARLGPTLVPLAYDPLRASLQGAAAPALAPEADVLTQQYALAASDKAALIAGLKLHHTLKQAVQDQRLDALAAECWSGLPRELGLNPCLGFVDDAYALACEGDVVMCVALLMVRYLTGARAYDGDVFDLDLDGRLTLIHCGGPASLAAKPSSVMVGQSQMAQARGFETITCRPQLPPGPVTLFRLYGPAYDQMHLAPATVIDSQTSPNLSVALQLAGDRWDFLSQCFGNHYVVAPGDLRPELGLLAEWLGIRIVET